MTFDKTKCTKGPWEIKRSDVTTPGGTMSRILEEGHSYADAALIAEAGTVLHETGLTPRELAERLETLMAAAVDVTTAMHGLEAGALDQTTLHAASRLESALAKEEGTNHD